MGMGSDGLRGGHGLKLAPPPFWDWERKKAPGSWAKDGSLPAQRLLDLGRRSTPCSALGSKAQVSCVWESSSGHGKGEEVPSHSHTQTFVYFEQKKTIHKIKQQQSREMGFKRRSA